MNQLSIEKILIIILVVAFLGGAFFFVFLSGKSVKQLELVYPIVGEKMVIEGNYEIKWKSKNISKVGIVLFEGRDAKWIAKDIDANTLKYNWQIQPGQKYGDNYWIAVFEYPYRETSKIDYSKGPFSITYMDVVSCDKISVSEEWPYMPISFPETRRVFITKNSYTGNLGGLDGANMICNEEAKELGYDGNWVAFIGGEKVTDTATQRLMRSSKGNSGVFIDADKDGEISRGDSCHRLLAKDFDSFISLFSSNKEKLESTFNENFSKSFLNLWTGRINSDDKINCLEIVGSQRRSLEENYTFTASCQNWVNENRLISKNADSSSEAPICFTPQGVSTKAIGIGGLSLGLSDNIISIQGRGCDEKKQIMCIED